MYLTCNIYTWHIWWCFKYKATSVSIYNQRYTINMFLYPLLGLTYLNILTWLYIYIQNSHTSICTDSKYIYIQWYTLVWMCRYRWSCLNSAKPISDCSHCGTCRDSRRQKKYCFVFYWRFLSQSYSCRLFFTETQPRLDRVLPEVFSLPYCFQYCCSVSGGWGNPGEQRCSNWEAPTEFNKGEGLNRVSRLLQRLVSVHWRGQKRSWGPRWMIIGAAMVCGW